MEHEEMPAEDGRVGELLRVNNELAAELRRLSADRAALPRPNQAAAARRVAVLIDERDTLTVRLEETEEALRATRADRDGLERQNREMDAEIVRLKSGLVGLLRRARGRLLGR